MKSLVAKLAYATAFCAGVPLLLKDLGHDYAGWPTTWGSRSMRSFVPEEHANVVRRYLDNEPERARVAATGNEFLRAHYTPRARARQRLTSSARCFDQHLTCGWISVPFGQCSTPPPPSRQCLISV